MAPSLLRAVPVLWLGFVLAAPAAEVSVRATREGEVLLIEASADFEGTVARTWQVLTDYDNLASFIPNLVASRVVSRTPEGVVVAQAGEARLLFFSIPIEVRLAIAEFPYNRVVSRAVAGNFREMSGTYTLEAHGARIRLRYSGRMVPDFLVPPLIGTWVLRHNVETTFGALVDEIVRRQARDEPAAIRRP